MAKKNQTQDCRAEHGAGQPDCPKCWPTSERNPDVVEFSLGRSTHVCPSRFCKCPGENKRA